MSSFTAILLEDAKYIPLVVIGCTSSFLSMLGSSSVIFMTSRVWKDQVQHRLLFCLSVADLCSSMASFWSPFLLPSYLGMAGAIGSHATCSAVGFFLTCSVMVGCCYNAYLSLYFMLVVRRNWKERDFTRPKEIAAHAFAFSVPLAINIAGVATQSINPSPGVNLCLPATSPWGCNEHDDIPCERSNEATVAAIAGSGLLFLLFFTFLGFLGTFLVWLRVRSTLKRSSAYQFEGEAQNSTTDDRLRQVLIQALLYSLAYFNTFFWPFVETVFVTVNSLQQIQVKKNNTAHYIMMILYWTFFPLQGAFNFFVYTRQKYQRWRKMEPDRSRFWIYRQIILSKAMPNANTMDRSRNTTRARNSAENTQRSSQ